MREAPHKPTNAQRQLMMGEPNALLSLVRMIFLMSKKTKSKHISSRNPKTEMSSPTIGTVKTGFLCFISSRNINYGYPTMFAPSESFFSILGDVITEKRNRFFPATTKIVAVVKDMVRKIRPGDEESGVESDDDNAGDDVELKDMISKEIDDVSGDQMEVDIAEAIEIN